VHCSDRHIVPVGQRQHRRSEWEERAGASPRNPGRDNDGNVMRVYLVWAPESGGEIR
jgi:hypothetical protein